MVVRPAAFWLLFLLNLTPALTSARAEPGGSALVGAKVYPSAASTAINDAVILMRNGRIEKVGTRASVRIPAGYRTNDQSGRVVVAGYWNNHVHLLTPTLLRASRASDADLEQELKRDFTRWGFTTVVDLASTTEIAKAVRGRVAAGSTAGPRVLSVGEPFYPTGATPIYARPFYKAFNLPSAEIQSQGSAVRRVRKQIRQGANGIKLFTGSIVGERDVVHMQQASILAITRTAHALGKPVFAHPTDKVGLELAVRNGVDVLAHTAPLAGPWSPSYARWIVGHRVALIPTLSLFEVQPHPSTPVGVAVQQTAALYRAGGVILFGTDAGFTDAFDTSAELRLMNEALGWRGVLASLTTSPAKVFGEARVRGRIAPGYLADIVVLGGDPADRVENLADVRLVISGGRTIYMREVPNQGSTKTTTRR